VQVFGDEFQTDPLSGRLIVTGKARAVRGDDELTADRLIYNPENGDITAEGTVVLRQAGRVVTAARLTYNFQQRAGRAERAVTDFKAYRIDASELFLKPGPVYVGKSARFSTCWLDHPHYRFYLRDATIEPEKRIVGRHVGIDFLGHRLTTVPRLEKSLAEGEQSESPYPSVGYNRDDGFYAEKDFTHSRSAPVWLKSNVRVNTFREPSGGLLASTRGKLQWLGALFYRDVAENQRARFLDVSRLPEVGVVWSQSPRPRVGRFLSHQVNNVKHGDEQETSERWKTSLQLTLGYFRQHRGRHTTRNDSESKNDGRLSFQAQAILPRVRLGPVTLDDFRLLARQNLYAGGEHYTVLGAGIGKEVRLGDFTLRADYFRHAVAGDTPFLFDAVELREEIRPSLEYRSSKWSLGYRARIRGGGVLYDQRFTVSRLFHCIEPQLSYSVRRSEIFLEVRIPGLSGRGIRDPGEPRTLDRGVAEPGTDEP
jgi:hypothetical protein